MQETQLGTEEALRTEITALELRIKELEQLEHDHQRDLQALTEKEAFNFALFQYNPVLTVIVDREGRVVRSNRAKLTSGDRLPNIGDIMYRDYASHHETDMYAAMMSCIRDGSTKSFPELTYGERTLCVTIAGFPRGAIITSQDITAQKNAERDRTNLIGELRRALDEVATLRGLLPICACCKKIRDDSGYWSHIEVYISKHTLADFTHTLCPDCVREQYPDYWQQMQENRAAAAAAAAQQKAAG